MKEAVHSGTCEVSCGEELTFYIFLQEEKTAMT